MLGILFDDVSRVNRLRLASKASRVTPPIGGSEVEVGAYHDGFCDSLAMDIEEA